MPPAVTRLANEDEPAIERLLSADRVVNLFLRGFLAVHPVDRVWWYGIRGDDEALAAAILVLPSRLAVPYALDPALGRVLGEHLHAQHAPCLLIGPRATCDALWARWAPGEAPARIHDQRLYTLEAPPAGDDPPGFRLGTVLDAEQVVPNAAAMEREDLGTDPWEDGRDIHEAAVVERLRGSRTWVIEQRRRIVFQVNVGTRWDDGCQLGGTYVPQGDRGRGLATAGIAAVCRRLLARYPRVTLHVNEANLPAVRAYERVGFVRDAALRLLVPR